MTTQNDTTLRAADAVFAAEQAVGRARRVVDELHNTISSALRMLDDAELDSAKAKHSDRRIFHLEAAAEHLGRLQNRCGDMPDLTHELFAHLNRATASITDARTLLEVADTSDPAVASEVAQLKPRLAVAGEMIALAEQVAQLAAQHVDGAHVAAHQASPTSLLEPVTLERSIATTGKELGRADEDARLLSDVVGHAASSARETAGIAAEITDNARRRMAEHGRDPVPRSAAPAAGAPAR